MKRFLLNVLLSFVAGVFLTLALVILTAPLLNWLEPRLGIELIGHSGPSDFVLWLYFVGSSAVVLTILFFAHRRSRSGNPSRKN